jgi:hypothetical protein
MTAADPVSPLLLLPFWLKAVLLVAGAIAIGLGLRGELARWLAVRRSTARGHFSLRYRDQVMSFDSEDSLVRYCDDKRIDFGSVYSPTERSWLPLERFSTLAAVSAERRINKRRQSTATSVVLLGMAALAFGAWWSIYTFYYAPTHIDDRFRAAPTQDTAGSSSKNTILSSHAALSSLISGGFSASRIEVLDGANVDVFIPRREFEDIAFPDRRAVMREMGDVWCSGVPHLYLPEVRVRDIRTGEKLAAFACFSKRIDLGE